MKKVKQFAGTVKQMEVLARLCHENEACKAIRTNELRLMLSYAPTPRALRCTLTYLQQYGLAACEVIVEEGKERHLWKPTLEAFRILAASRRGALNFVAKPTAEK
ncbi:hypothetical protein [Chitinibacter tainanensis]|uniref:hypothetical protein n=1 Tax=Chitinibacter tainanensis TaxID=230667 RepID=UPI0004910AF6|nr:hypothetical protein [Chitinibacter tainanensis]